MATKFSKKQLAILAAASADANRTVMSQIVGEEVVVQGVPAVAGSADGVGGICKVCGNNMLRVDTCELIPVPLKNKHGRHVKSLKPIRFGQESRFGDDGASFGPNDRCHDCGVKVGGFHHPGCDMEECPGCHGQMLMCGGECA